MKADDPIPTLLKKLDCVRIPVPDLDQALTFYRNGLGLEVIWRMETDVGLRLPDSNAELVLHTEALPLEIDFAVEDTSEAVRKFEALGGNVLVPPFEIEIGKAAVVQDPWGNSFVLLDASKGLLEVDDQGRVIGNLAIPRDPHA